VKGFTETDPSNQTALVHFSGIAVDRPVSEHYPPRMRLDALRRSGKVTQHLLSRMTHGAETLEAGSREGLILGGALHVVDHVDFNRGFMRFQF
jgi:hypothetical protein